MPPARHSHSSGAGAIARTRLVLVSRSSGIAPLPPPGIPCRLRSAGARSVAAGPPGRPPGRGRDFPADGGSGAGRAASACPCGSGGEPAQEALRVTVVGYPCPFRRAWRPEVCVGAPTLPVRGPGSFRGRQPDEALLAGTRRSPGGTPAWPAASSQCLRCSRPVPSAPAAWRARGCSFHPSSPVSRCTSCSRAGRPRGHR